MKKLLLCLFLLTMGFTTYSQKNDTAAIMKKLWSEHYNFIHYRDSTIESQKNDIASIMKIILFFTNDLHTLQYRDSSDYNSFFWYRYFDNDKCIASHFELLLNKGIDYKSQMESFKPIKKYNSNYEDFDDLDRLASIERLDSVISKLTNIKPKSIIKKYSLDTISKISFLSKDICYASFQLTQLYENNDKTVRSCLFIFKRERKKEHDFNLITEKRIRHFDFKRHSKIGWYIVYCNVDEVSTFMSMEEFLKK